MYGEPIIISYPIEIVTGFSVDYVGLGNDFTIIVSSDGGIHYWGDPEKAPKCLSKKNQFQSQLSIGEPRCPSAKNQIQLQRQLLNQNNFPS